MAFEQYADHPQRGPELLLRVEGLSGATPEIQAFSHAFEAGRLHVIDGAANLAESLLSMLALNPPPAEGAIVWRDQVLTNLQPDQQALWRRLNLGLVGRSNQLVSVMSVRDHVRMAASIRSQPLAEAHGLALLELLGLGAQLDQRPAGLSGSEKQRLALALALCTRPALVLVTEPSAAQDRTSAALVAHLLRSYARDARAVVICASADRVMIDAADSIVHL